MAKTHLIVGHVGPIPAGYYACAIGYESNGLIGPGHHGTTTSVLVCESCGAVVANVVAHSTFCSYGKEPDRVE